MRRPYENLRNPWCFGRSLECQKPISMCEKELHAAELEFIRETCSGSWNVFFWIGLLFCAPTTPRQNPCNSLGIHRLAACGGPPVAANTKKQHENHFWSPNITFGGRSCFYAPGGARAPDTQKSNRKPCLEGGQDTLWTSKVHFIRPGPLFSLRDLFLRPEVHFWRQNVKSCLQNRCKSIGIPCYFRSGPQKCAKLPKSAFWDPETTFWGSGAPNCGI